jgi:hypothetical protein
MQTGQKHTIYHLYSSCCLCVYYWLNYTNEETTTTSQMLRGLNINTSDSNLEHFLFQILSTVTLW